ncbi:MAG: alpha/beta hydrolase [Rhodospirillaceae bacterium]|nr:alpha/beta hydrolase [Rhodospirillaceae bacterium]
MLVRAAFVIMILASAWSATAGESQQPKTDMVPSANDVPVAVTTWGNSKGPGVLFVHGFLASTLNWQKQIHANLGETYNMASVDMRGHGASAKPIGAANYTGTKVWADDIAAAIKAAGMSKPLLVAWSYGGFFIMDYVRHYGTANVGGIVLAGTTAGLIPPPPPPEMTPARQEQINRNTSPNLETIINWTNGYMGFLMSDGALPANEAEIVKISALLVPHYVRPFLREHPTNNSDLAAKVNVPVMFISGTKDGSAKIDDVRAAAAAVKGSQVKEYEGIGTMTFWYAPDRFNGDIAKFASSLNQGRAK